MKNNLFFNRIIQEIIEIKVDEIIIIPKIQIILFHEKEPNSI